MTKRLRFGASALFLVAPCLQAQSTVQYVTAGTTNVTINNLVSEDQNSPNVRFVPAPASSPVGCGAGFALASATTNNTFPLSSGAATFQTGVADAAIAVGDLVTASSTTAGSLHDTGAFIRSSVPVTECIVGLALTGATAAGQTVSLLYDGPGSYGTGNVNSNSTAFHVGRSD